MSPSIVFVHGWGFDAGIWDQLRARLTDVPTFTIDLGFRHAKNTVPELPVLPAGELIAVGHSLGFLWLLKNKPFAWNKLVSINGFSKFIAADDFPSGLDARMLKRMIEQCKKDPQTVVADFFKTCGHEEKIETLNQDELVQGLLGLKDWDMRKTLRENQTPLLALAGDNDPIVPRPLTEASFANKKDTQLQWHDGGHLLPLSAPVWCAERIRNFIGLDHMDRGMIGSP